MKIKFNTNLIINTVAVLFVFMLFFQWYGFNHVQTTTVSSSADRSGDRVIDWHDDVEPIDATLSDTIPYRKYMILKDSIKTMRNFKNGDGWGSGTDFNNIAGTTSSIAYKDGNTLKDFHRYIFSDLHPMQCYITLPGWRLNYPENLLNYDSLQFHVEHNQAYVRKTMEEQSTDKKTGKISYYQHYVDVPVKFRYHQAGPYIMIPVTESAKKQWGIILLVCGITLGFYMLYLLMCFIKFVADLSKGLVFTDRNVNRLKLIAISFLAYPVLTILLHYIMKLIFRSYFTSDVVLNKDVFSNSCKIILIGLIFLLLFRAFRQGKILKEEQDLTV